MVMVRLLASKPKMELVSWRRVNILVHWYEYIGDLYDDNRGEPHNLNHQSRIKK